MPADFCLTDGLPLWTGGGTVWMERDRERQIKEINNLYNFNVMFTKQSMPQRYEAPSVRVHHFSAESGFAASLEGNSISRWVVEDGTSSEPELNF